MKWLGMLGRVIGVVLAIAGLTADLPTAAAQTFADPAMGWLQVALRCDGTSLTSGQAEFHFHGFGGPRVGAPREVSPPPLRCTPDDPVLEFAVYVAIPPIWHVYLTPTTLAGSTMCEVDGTTLPASERCGDPDDGVTIEIAIASVEP
jgi:hypothetical protein